MPKKEKDIKKTNFQIEESIYKDIQNILIQAHNNIARAINSEMVIAYWNIGKYIFESQGRKERADYGSYLIKYLSERLTNEFGRGFSERNLKNMRLFYQFFPIRQTLSAQFKLSWSHYTTLMRINNPDERSFYEIESVNNNWSVRELERQYHSSLYERLALSRDKNKVIELSKKGQVTESFNDIMKSPLVLEFLGLEENDSYSESDLETAIIAKLQEFLLELGNGFLFEARQKRFSFDNQNFYVDLVFYNRLLKCYILIDLKIDKLTHQDLGQMQMYVNYFDRNVKLEEEKPTIGILLCKEKSDLIVELTLPKDANICASEYKLYLPNKKILQEKLEKWISEFKNNNNK